MSQTLPLDMLGGLAKANTWVAKPNCHNLLLLLPLDMLGAWLKANLRVVRPKDIIPKEYKASCHCEHAL
jgi:hypothetical protein